MRTMLLLLAVAGLAQAAPTTITINAGCAALSWDQAAQVLTCAATTTPPVIPPVQPPASCTGFDAVKTLPMAWPSSATGSTNGYTAAIDHMGPNDAIIIELTTPPILPNKILRLSWGEYGRDPNPSRKLVLSDQRCDFTKGLGAGSIKTGIGGSIIFSGGTNGFGYPQLPVAGRKYYINVRNNDVCSAVHCDFQVELSPPQ
jgi:hypothetical protein